MTMYAQYGCHKVNMRYHGYTFHIWLLQRPLHVKTTDDSDQSRDSDSGRGSNEEVASEPGSPRCDVNKGKNHHVVTWIKVRINKGTANKNDTFTLPVFKCYFCSLIDSVDKIECANV